MSIVPRLFIVSIAVLEFQTGMQTNKSQDNSGRNAGRGEIDRTGRDPVGWNLDGLMECLAHAVIAI